MDEELARENYMQMRDIPPSDNPARDAPGCDDPARDAPGCDEKPAPENCDRDMPGGCEGGGAMLVKISATPERSSRRIQSSLQ